MNSLSLLRFLFVFALIFLSVAVANPVEIQTRDAFSLSPSNDDGREPLNPGATNVWAQTPDNIENSLAKPLDGSDPSNCFGERTKNLGKRQARPEMCQENYQMDRKAGQTPVKNNPAVGTPVDAPNMLSPNPQKSSTDEEKVCTTAPQSAINPVCAWIESVVEVEGSVVGFFELDFCRPYHYYTPCATPELLWCCAQVFSKSPVQTVNRHLDQMYAYAGYRCILWDDTMSEHRGTFSHWP